MRFSVYQQKKGWGSLVEVTHYGSERYKLSDFFEYHRVATIEADDLEEVFHIKWHGSSRSPDSNRR